MNTDVLKHLENIGCKTIHKDQLSAVVKCNNSYLVKSPSKQWELLVPSTKLAPLSKSVIVTPRPKYIDVGRFVQKGNWGRLFSFHINNEVKYYFDKDSLKHSDDPEIKKRMDIMKDQEHFFSEDIINFDIQKDYKMNLHAIASRLNDITREKLKEKFKSPIVCHTNPQLKKFWMPEGERIVYRLSTTCVIPNTKTSVESIIGASLTNETISQSDVRYITSAVTKNKKFMLSGIHLYHRGAHLPMVRFTARNENVLLSKNIKNEIKEIEKEFTAKNKPVQSLLPVSKDIFTRYLLS